MIIPFPGCVPMVKGGYFIQLWAQQSDLVDALYVATFLDGIQWALGDIDGPSASIPQTN